MPMVRPLAAHEYPRLAHEPVDVQRVDKKLDHPLGDPLSDRLDRVGHSPAGRPQPFTRIHAT
jgi:hypothetical protein